MAVNVRLSDPDAVGHLPIDHFDGLDKFDDLPVAYRDNVNVEAPFDRKPGDKPAMSDQDMRDIIAFLKTLNDGYASSHS